MQVRRPFLVLAIVSATIISSLSNAQDTTPEIVAPASRNVTPSGVTPGPSVSGPLIREPIAPAPPDPPRWRRFFLPKTTDAASFLVDDRTIRIAGVRAPEPESECRRSNGSKWPCGRTALHSIRMFLRGRAVECLFANVDNAIEITVPCRVGATDIGLWLLSQGWVVPDDLASDEYKRASNDARCSSRGLWRGTIPDETCRIVIVD